MTIAFCLAAAAETPDSVLRERAGHAALLHQRPMFIGDRPRVSTCSDVAWLGSDVLVTSNLAGQALHVYRYRADTRELTHRQTVHSMFPLGGVALSPDKEWLAVTHSDPGFRVALHAVSANATVSLSSAVESPVLGRKFVHGVRFSPDGRYLVVTQFAIHSSVVVLDARTLAIVRELPTPFISPDVQLAKSACFSLDGRFIFISYSKAASLGPGSARAAIAAHAYCGSTGELSEPLCSISDGLKNVEALALTEDGTILAVDQYANQVLALSFDRQRMSLVNEGTVLDARDGLSFPHGISVAPGGAIALTDHVRDGVRVFVPTEEGITR